jgi:hypothetical protein
MLDPLKQIFQMTWLWSIFAGFYLVAYAFWVPRLFSSLPLVVLAIIVTLALGGSILADGFSRAMQLQTGKASSRKAPFLRATHLLGGLVLLAYVSVYLPPGGRIVAHWPLDLAITVLSGVIILAYGFIGE